METVVFGISILVIFFITCLIYCTITEINKRQDVKTHRATNNEMYKLDQKAMRSLDTSSFKKASASLSEFESAYSQSRNTLSNSSRRCYDNTLKDLRDNCSTIVQHEWHEKAYRILEKLYDMYYTIMTASFSDVDEAYKVKSRCLKQYDAYWDWTRECSDKLYGLASADNLWDNARREIKDYLSDDDFPFKLDFDSTDLSVRQQLERNISEQIEKMRPEYKRKMRLYSDILSVVQEKESIMRSQLLKMPFSNATHEEVACCYKSLVKQGKVVEIKIGNRYFVSLSDKEKQRCKVG